MKCVLCGLTEENIDHLLICCPFSKSIWYNLCNKCNISCVRRNSEGFICWISHFRGKSFPSHAVRIILAAVVYATRILDALCLAPYSF
jgi:hypothetical protein